MKFLPIALLLVAPLVSGLAACSDAKPQQASSYSVRTPNGVTTFQKSTFPVLPIFADGKKVATYQLTSDGDGHYAIHYEPDSDFPGVLAHGSYTCNSGAAVQFFDPRHPFDGYLNGCAPGNPMTVSVMP